MSSEFFPEVNEAWAKLPAPGGGTPSALFIEAVDKFVPMFDRLGAVFSPVKGDVGGNVNKLKKALAANPADTLQQLLKAEKEAGKSTAKEAAAVALLWLKRALQFVFALLDKVCNAGMDSNKAAKEAYEEILMQYHGFVVKKVFQTAMMAAPGSATLLGSLGSNPDNVLLEMKRFSELSKPQMDAIDAFLVAEGLDDKSKV